ncbi:ABC-three component system middle component 8 [Lentzea sp. CA-135723]|uniref:ABC-three component system middle component 8 n=1 Tax=Lentzea sp. CA-135723 TaxID=3239950 RepID=UPI003D8C1D54
MLLPNKHSHPDETVLAAATLLLRSLRRKRAVRYDELKEVLNRKSGSADYLFTPAISLLYLLDLVDYKRTVDTFEYTGQL